MKRKPAEGTPALRETLLSAKPSEFKIAPTPELPRVWAAMMEMRVGKADVSLVAVADGTTSMYFSTGGGVIGGGQHESVRGANRQMLILIERLYPAFVARESPLEVVAGAVSFAVLTHEGLRVARDTEERLIQKKSPLWPVRYAGEQVITALRVATEKGSHG